MSRKRACLPAYSASLFLLWFIVLVPGLVMAQEGEPATQDAGTAADGETLAEGEFIPEEGEFIPEGEGDDLSLLGETADFGDIQDILALDEEVMNDPGTYTYDPGARRDPFVSLAERREGQQNRVDEERPEGPAGLLIEEISVEGVFILPDGPVAQIQSVGQGTSFLLRPGDQLWDGDVVSISFQEVVFKQSVDDPTALKPFREVVKRLEP